MAEHEERAPRGQRACGRVQRPRELVVRELKIEDGDEVERTGLRDVHERICDDPLDVDAAARRQSLRLLDRDVGPLGWFEALALWKAAVFCEAIYGRFVRGELGAEDARAAAFEGAVPQMAEAAAERLGAVGRAS